MSTSAMSRFEYSEQRIINNRRRRNQELKRHIILLFVSVLLFAVLAILLFSTKTLASDGSEPVMFKGYKSVQIMPGDTLSSLSYEYLSDGYKSAETLMNEIEFINNLSSKDVLISGNYLIVPYYETING